MLQSAPAPPFSSLRSLSLHYILLPSHFLPPGGGGGVLPRLRRGDLAIRMGGGPRTFPGGVSKWQWKRMQAKKARQLLKARLARERQLYEMRKRAELRDAVAHLERPWDPDSSSAAADASAVAPNLLSVAAEDQLRALADRFHRPGGVDLSNDRDGPRVFASPATGAASARFFPRNAFHSVQPYALVGAGGEASAQGVRENAAEDEAYSGIADREPAAELSETVSALGDADDSTAGDWTSEDDDDDDDGNDNDAISESEGMAVGDVGSWRDQRPMVRRNGRSNGVARWEAAGAMASRSDNDRGWRGDAFFSDSERGREGRREQTWQERSTSASPRKQASGGRTGLKITAGSHVRQRGRQTGAGSFSESEVIRGGSEPKWRASKGKRDDTRNGAGRWNAPKMDWVGDVFDSESDSARGRELEPRREARNKMNGSDSLRGRSTHNYSANASGNKMNGSDSLRGRSTRNYSANANGNKMNGSDSLRGRSTRSYSANANGGEKLLKYLRGDPHANSNDDFAEDLEVPKWKPRRMNRARNNNGGRDDDMGGRFRRGEDGARVRYSRGNGSIDGGRKTSRNGGRRLWGDEYSLRPTSELRGSWPNTGSEGL